MPIIFFFSTFLAISLAISSVNLFADSNFIDEYKIGPNDVVSIKVWDNDDLDRTVEISQEGSFTFPLIGKIYAGGLSVFELENIVKRKLANGYLIAPQVTVDIKAYGSQKVFLFGEVRRPGSYFLKRKTHILELISQAGGFTGAAGQIVTIVRNKGLLGGGKTVSHNNKKNENTEIIKLDLGKFNPGSRYDVFFVQNGDSVYINEVQRYFVTGEVKKTGEFKWGEGTTVRHAISMAGGVKESAALKRAKFIRVINGKEREIKAGMNDIVMSDDVIFVPERLF